MATSWGPLQPLQALLLAQLDETAGADDGAGRQKALDAALARELAGDEMGAALKAAALEQLDAALAHDLLEGGSRPTALLILLTTKASKVEALQQRRLGAEAQQQVAASAALFVSQAARFLVHAPMSLVNKEMKRVSLLCATLANVAVELDVAIKAVFPLRSLLSRFHHQPNSAFVTPIHGHFFYLCLRAKTYAAASDVLALPLTEIHPQPQLVDSVDFLRYAYYGGVLLLGEKRFHDAMDFFLLAVTAPADALSVFVIEAYKKLVLASLLADGEPSPLPKYTSFVVSRHLESHSVIYTDLARAFVVDRDVAAMRAVVEQHEATFSKDGNLGLVHQCIVALQHRKLLQLTRTYATIGLAELAGAAGIAESNSNMTDGAAQEPVVSTGDAEKMLLELISSGQMDAVIDRQEGKVTFVLEDENGDKAELDNAEMMQRLQQEMQKLVFVASRLRDMDAELVTSAKFQTKLAKEKDRRQRLAMHNQQSDEGIDAAPGVSMDTSE